MEWRGGGVEWRGDAWPVTGLWSGVPGRRLACGGAMTVCGVAVEGSAVQCSVVEGSVSVTVLVC